MKKTYKEFLESFDMYADRAEIEPNFQDYIENRVLDVAKYIIDSKSTIRKTAKIFGVSKSTIHKDMTERLPLINPQIAEQAKIVLDINKSERHIRGGKATKMKYKAIEG